MKHTSVNVCSDNAKYRSSSVIILILLSREIRWYPNEKQLIPLRLLIIAFKNPYFFALASKTSYLLFLINFNGVGKCCNHTSMYLNHHWTILYKFVGSHVSCKCNEIIYTSLVFVTYFNANKLRTGISNTVGLYFIKLILHYSSYLWENVNVSY
jgi:hypothetical protein